MKDLEEKGFEIEIKAATKLFDKQSFSDLLSRINKLDFVFGIYGLSEKIRKTIGAPVAKGINIEVHEWFNISTNVYKVFGKFLGITHVSNISNESMDLEDCYIEIKAFEMVEKQVVTYVKKEIK